MPWLRWLGCLLLALLPSCFKVPVYRVLFGYKIGRRVRIGFSPFIGVEHCTIGDNVRIGHLNCFYRVSELIIGDHVSIGFLNILRGGARIEIGSYVSILRQNTLNAILEGDFQNEVESVLELGTGTTVTSGHWLDFSAGIHIGPHSIVGGRNSSLWTHNRQRGRPIEIGCHCYLGSEARLAPGVAVAPFCVVALGSVLVGRYSEPRSLIGGNPAAMVRSLEPREYPLVTRKNRKDIPDDVVRALVPPELLGDGTPLPAPIPRSMPCQLPLP
jgi:acetyltransferase-like isoleucine patch superfamily enzyme